MLVNRNILVLSSHWTKQSSPCASFLFFFFCPKLTSFHFSVVFKVLLLFSPSPLLLRTEPSSTWRASTTHRWSTTRFWWIADTLTRTRNITATLGDAERGTAYQLAWADRNHSTLYFSSLSSLAARSWLFIHRKGRWTGRRARDQQFLLWGCRHVEQQPWPPTSSSFYRYLSISAWPLFSFVSPVLRHFQYFFSSPLFQVRLCLLVVCVGLGGDATLPRSLDLLSTLAAKLPAVQCLFLFLQFTLKNKLFHFVQ